MNANETIEDIIAEKRERADEIERDVAAKMASGEMVSEQYAREVIADLRMEADRLDAAAKRERGNAAAMREALVELRNASRNFYNQILNSQYSKILDKYTCERQGFPAVLHLRYAIPKANRALSSPPRNFDLYDNKTDAETRFVEETGENDMAQHYWQMFANWLFYTAAERKGEGDGE